MPAHTSANRQKKPKLTPSMILAWADHHRKRTGEWPIAKSGPVLGAAGETWKAVDNALADGYRGLRGGDSLSRLLRRERGKQIVKYRLHVGTIVRWAKEHRARTGEWPTRRSGPVHGCPPFTWLGINSCLIHGLRGLSGGTTLTRTLARHCGVRSRKILQTLTVQKILGWAEDHHRRTGRWPKAMGGLIHGLKPRMVWYQIETALRKGRVPGVPPDTSLARFLVEWRGARKNTYGPDLSVAGILAWADAHHARTGQWPKRKSGAIPEAPGETWTAIDLAVARGTRGLTMGTTLPRLLASQRGAPLFNPSRGRLSIPGILAWIDAYRARTGRWPKYTSGRIPEAPGESWSMVNRALEKGRRGLPGGQSLFGLLVERRQVPEMRKARLR